jgi:hypothetical protein
VFHGKQGELRPAISRRPEDQLGALGLAVAITCVKPTDSSQVNTLQYGAISDQHSRQYQEMRKCEATMVKPPKMRTVFFVTLPYSAALNVSG